ncbi:hypothetical protein MTBPR1_140007 [Candidatus Terasakiella magnetica]|uniref:Uncharacterized protein n=1 Tax=Candidatus Terasakiella magnetica TaxID=1867952 RepID=A0A1C3RF47_9PROT|nr:hypothetical protein [Candidatus Terasakiella magnetica]SCA55889.1 hypothetical protein MTBPR1_140007 [Candidatus Terasakiella magnetica]
METFEEFIARNGTDQDMQSLTESFLSQVRAEVLLIGKRVDDLEGKIQAENDLARKIDLLAKQKKWASFLSICILAIQMKDISILRRIRKR